MLREGHTHIAVNKYICFPVNIHCEGEREGKREEGDTHTHIPSTTICCRVIVHGEEKKKERREAAHTHTFL